MSNILLVGEQVTSCTFEIKGFDYFGSQSYKEDGFYLVNALESKGHKVTWMKTCDVQIKFPEKLEELNKFDVILLSDVGSNTLLFHPEMLNKSIPHPNRLKLLKEYVLNGKALVMIGGWMSFAGIDGRARYHGSYVEEVLPVTCSPYDDRIEVPEGVTPIIVSGTHEIMKNIPNNIPYFLGYNKVFLKNTAELILKVENDPLLAVWQCGKGKSAVFTSDCAPHWGPKEFLDWEGYPTLWDNLVRWLVK